MAGADTIVSRARSLRLPERLLFMVHLLASAQFAVALIAFLAVAGLLATVLPQVPVPIRDSPVAIDLWVETKKDTFGPLTEFMQRVGLFNIVRTWWFLGGLGLLAVSICVYIADRLVATWRNVSQPRERLPDSFFERAANRITLATPADAGAEGSSAQLERTLRRRRFSVRSFAAGDTTYVFADRFAWAEFGNFVSHLALVLFLVGGLVSQLGGFTAALLIAEGTASPVFAVSHPDQMQVEVIDAVATFGEDGLPQDYRSELVIYQGGAEVARGVTTVNGPLKYNGYRFHQAGYFGEGVALRVIDVGSNSTVYREALALEGLSVAPAVIVQDASGRTLLDDVIVPTDYIEETPGALITVPGTSRTFWVGTTRDEADSWNLIVYEGSEGGDGFLVPAGEARTEAGLTWMFPEAAGLPSIVTAGIPGDSERSLVMLSETPEGIPFVTVLGPVDGRALTLYPDQPVRVGDKEYRFEGRREFGGIEVRKDPGVNFIWAAAGLLLAGLLVTFYVPRLRLWARVRPEETVIAGTAERGGVFQTEAKALERELGRSKADGQGGETDV